MTDGSPTLPHPPLSADLVPHLADGTVLAERYRIERFLARGGAGEVYVAEDLVLGGEVALKTVRRDGGESRNAVERFKREIQIARQVTHPNVCRLYEFGSHELPSGELLFLTMELLPGITLYERIHQDGRLTPYEALPLVRQLAAGIDAAHQVGVVHRDFKSGNVMLVPGPAGERAVITDFGLARIETSSDPRLTAEDRMVGTPTYMAPEQVQGLEVGPPADLYAFGLVIFEMLTGTTPFAADSAMATAVRRLTVSPSSPRTFVPDLPESWERAILHCLEREPEDRPPTAGAVVEALGELSGHASGTASSGASPSWPRAGDADRSGRGGDTQVFARGHDPSAPGRPRGAAETGQGAWLRPVLLALGGTLVAILLVWWLVDWRGSAYQSRTPRSGLDQPAGAATARDFDRGDLPDEVEARQAVAIVGFRNLSGVDDDAWLSSALAEMLATEAAAGDTLRAVAGGDVARVLQELDLEPAAVADPADAARVANNLGGDVLVTGGYLVTADREIRLDLAYLDAAGRTTGRSSLRGSEAALLDLVEEAGREIRRALGAEPLAPAEVAAVRAALPAGAEAARLYAQGLERLRLHQDREALELLQGAVRLEPENSLAHAALARAWMELGYQTQAALAARRAHETAAPLGRRDRLRVEAAWHALDGRRDRAAALYAALLREVPDDFEVGLRLAEIYADLGRTEPAQAVVDTLRRGAPAALQPRIDLAEAEVARAGGDIERQQRAAEAAVSKAELLGAELLRANALEAVAGALRDSGRPVASRAAFQEALEVYREADHRGPVARVQVAIAKLLRREGRFDEASALIEDAMAVARDIGDQGTLKHALNTRAILYRQQGRLRDALATHRLELEANENVGDARGVEITLSSIGAVERRLGQLDDAAERFAKALELGRARGDERAVAISANQLAEIRLRQARLDDAEALFQEARGAEGGPRSRGYTLAGLAEIAAERGEGDRARELAKEALALREELGETTNAGYSLLDLASIAIDAGRNDDARGLADRAAEIFEAQDKSDARARALATRAVAESRDGDTQTAFASIDQARDLVEGSESREAPLWIDFRVAQALSSESAALRGRAIEAGPLYDRVAERADGLGLRDLALAARLGAARQRDDTERLEALRAEASRLGYARLAQAP